MKIWFNFLGLCQCVRIIYLVSSVRRASQRLSTSGRGNSCSQKSMISDFWICLEEAQKPGRGEGRASEMQNTASWFPENIIFDQKCKGNMRYDRRCALHTCSLRMSAETWSTSLNLVGWSLTDCWSHMKQKMVRLSDQPVCKSGHYGLNPTGRIVQGLDEEVPGLEMIMNKIIQQFGKGTWCPTWGWWSRRSNLPQRALSNPRPADLSLSANYHQS